MVDREKIVYRTNEYTYDFRNFQTINTFGREINNGTITLKEAYKYQGDLLVKTLNFRKQIKPKNPKKNKRKKIFLRIYIIFLKAKKMFLMPLITKYFQ